MITPFLVVAKNTYIEMKRDRVLYFVVVFALLFMGICVALGQLSFEEIFRLSVSLGLSGIQIAFAGLTIFLGCSVFAREIERKTIYTLLVRPITREQYLFGKYLGLLGILLTMLVGFAVCFCLIQLLLGMPLLLSTYVPFIGIFVEATILLAIAFLFSTFAKPFLSVTGTLAFFLIGHWIGNLEFLVTKSEDPLFKIFGTMVTHVFPNLETLNWRDFAVAKAMVPGYEILAVVGLSILWASFYFLLSLNVFRRKDFE